MGAGSVASPREVSQSDGIARVPVNGARQRATFPLPPIRLSDGTVEGLKWLGVGLMTLDHVNKYLLHERIAALFALGRLALPIFGAVLAFNLARSGTRDNGAYRRVALRLAIVAVIAEVPFIGLGGLAWGWFPFNILATLLVSTSIIWLLDLGAPGRRALAVLLFLFGGAFVEFWWPALAMCLAAWSYCRRPSAWALFWWTASIAALYVINRNFWALAALPVIFYAPHVRLSIPRIRWAFYAYFPTHLAAIWLLCHS